MVLEKDLLKSFVSQDEGEEDPEMPADDPDDATLSQEDDDEDRNKSAKQGLRREQLLIGGMGEKFCMA